MVLFDWQPEAGAQATKSISPTEGIGFDFHGVNAPSAGRVTKHSAIPISDVGAEAALEV